MTKQKTDNLAALLHLAKGRDLVINSDGQVRIKTRSEPLVFENEYQCETWPEDRKFEFGGENY